MNSQIVFSLWSETVARLEGAGRYLSFLFLRLILAWEFWESGVTKLNGENWFAQIPWAEWQSGFPIPLNWLSDDLNWLAATWGELILAVMLAIGLATRFTAFSLIIVTMVATAAVHWPAQWSGLAELWQGYVITSNGFGNYKLPLLFVVMLIPLVFQGGGKISIDQLLSKLFKAQKKHAREDLATLGLALLVMACVTIFVMPVLGLVFLFASLSLLAWKLNKAL